MAFTSSKFADAMQLRTRKEYKFDEVEAGLPDPKALSNSRRMSRQSSRLADNTPSGDGSGLRGIIAKIGNLNPFGRALAEGDLVWLLDNTAYKQDGGSAWRAEFVAAVFEKDDSCKVADMVSGIAKTVGLADDAAERDTIEKRIAPFLWDVQLAKTIRVEHLQKSLKLNSTSFNGISTSTQTVGPSKDGSAVKGKATVPTGVSGIMEMETYYTEPEGWGIISGELRIGGEAESIADNV